MITVVTGTPGSGKSCYGVVSMLDKLASGGMVATNIAVDRRFFRVAARRNPSNLVSPRRYAHALDRIERSFAQIDQPEQMRLIWPRDQREGSTLIVVDESYGVLDGRDYRGAERKAWIDWLTQHRKLGVDVMFICQHVEMLDVNVRRLAQFEVRLRDLRRARAYGLPVPVPASVAHWFTATVTKPTRTQMFRPSRAHGLFDTKATLNGVSADPPAGAILLPRAPHAASTESVRSVRQAAELGTQGEAPTPAQSRVNGPLGPSQAPTDPRTTEGEAATTAPPSRDGALAAPLDDGP